MASCAGARFSRRSPIGIAKSFEDEGKTDDAIEILKNASQDPREKNKVEIYLRLADLYEKKDDIVSRIEVLKKAKSADGKRVDVRLKLGVCFLNAGLHDEAEKELLYLVSLGAENPTLWKSLGEIYYEKGRLGKADFYFRKFASAIDDSGVFRKLFEINETLGNFADARSFLASAAGEFSDEEFSKALAVDWMKDGNPAEAIDELERLKETGEKNFLLGLAYYEKPDLEKAEFYFEKAGKAVKPARFFLALIYWQKKEKKKALDIFRALSVDEKFAPYCAVFLD